MKTKRLIIAGILALPFLLSMSGNTLYEKAYESYDARTPESYQVEITGAIVEKQLDTVSADQFPAGRSKAALMFYFKKGFQPKLLVKNVSSFYQTMFSIFLPQLEATGFYVLLAHEKGYAAFSKRFTIASIANEDDFVKVKVLNAGGGARLLLPRQ